jgi:putative nucleotidyltransferase with HDIG domain
MYKDLDAIFNGLDQYTARHSLNVQRLVDVTARLYSLNQAQQLKDAAKYHDIGKLLISKEILFKPGKLTSEEYESIKSHTYLGRRILNSVSSPAIFEEVALKHHEMLNGSGYPFKLTADAIPLHIRVVSTCDIYDALISERPYKRPFSYKETKAILINDATSGKLDRDVVDKVLTVGKMIKKEEVMCNYSDLKFITRISPDVACDICDMNLKYGRILSPAEFKIMYKELGKLKEQGFEAPDFEAVDNIVKGLNSAKREFDHQKLSNPGLGSKTPDIEL